MAGREGMAGYAPGADPTGCLKDIRCFALDMDGTVYLEDRVIPGTADFLQAVTDSGRHYVFLTNNSSKNAEVYLRKLARLELPCEDRQLVTSGHATAAYLREHFPGKRVFLLGNQLLAQEFCDSGISLCQNGAEVVVTAFDNSLTYDKLCMACDYVRAGLPYIATHPDFNCPVEAGFVPDIGAIHAFIEASTGRRPDRIIGKPNREIVDYTVSRTGIPAAQTAMVGDRLYTDIATGVNHGMCAVLVLTGETKEPDLARSPVQPHLVFRSLADIIPCL